MIKLAIAEDNSYSLQALVEKLSAYSDTCILFTATDGRDMLNKLEENSAVDLILMDIEMPGMNGIDATENIKRLYPNIKIVMITIYDNDEYIFSAIKAGADSYILKETKAPKIYETIQDTLQGGAVMSPSIAVKTMSFLKNSIVHPATEKTNELYFLSERETEILEQISKGFTNKIISSNLHISPFTVKRHIENIYQKLKAKNRIELLAKAKNSGLI